MAYTFYENGISFHDSYLLSFTLMSIIVKGICYWKLARYIIVDDQSCLFRFPNE